MRLQPQESQVLTNTVNSLTTTYRYDDIGQITSESRTGYSGSYTYDANGNRLTRTVGGVTENYAYDDADKLQDVKIGGVTQKSYGYDSAGRTTSVVSSAGTTTLAYDYEGRISTITYPSTATNTFTYNGLDTRVSKVDSAGTSTYKRDGAGVTAPVLSDASAVYTPGISERRSSTTTYLHSGLKNADSQSGTGQTLGASRQYDAFGNLTASTGLWNGPFGYAGAFGYQEDPDSSLKLLGHRYYDSSTGRFLTRDPAKDGRNWYGYCGNSPIRKLDATGLLPDWLRNAWDNFVDWASGRDAIDRNGNHVRIGGWPALVIPDGVAQTYGGTVHLNDEDDFERYNENDHWRNHEEGHLQQNKRYPLVGLFLLDYADAAIMGAGQELLFGLPGDGNGIGHRYNRMEIEAEWYAIARD